MKVSSCITGVQHIGLPTGDIKKTVAFYKSLGFKIASQTVNESTGEQVVFLQLKNLIIETYENKCVMTQAGAIDHVALDVSDIDIAFDIIEKSDFTILDKEIQFLPFWENGVKFFNILGPNGEKIEFCQKLKGVVRNV